MTLGWATAGLRRWREERAPTLALLVLALLSALVVALAPRLLARAADDTLREEIAAAPAGARNLEVIEETRLRGDASAPFAALETLGDEWQELMPQGVRSLITTRRFVVDSGRWTITSEMPMASTLALRVQEAADEHIRYVEGRPPIGAVETATEETPEGPVEMSVVEVALSRITAEQLEVALGDGIGLVPDRTDLIAPRGEPPPRVDARVVGIYEVVDPQADYWLEDPSLLRPSIRALSAEVQFRDATALLSPDAYLAISHLGGGGNLTMRYAWRFYVDPARLRADRSVSLIADLRRLETHLHTRIETIGQFRGTTLRTDLLRLVEGHHRRWSSVEEVLLVVALGPAMLGAAALGLVAVLAARRRLATLRMWVARGASRTQVVISTALEALLVVVPAALVAFLAASALLPGAIEPLGAAGVAAVGLAAASFVVAAVALVRVSDGRDGRETLAAPTSPRRLVLEALVIGLAAGGAYLIHDRGLPVGDGDGSPNDPLIAAVPALAGFAAGLLAVRLLPLPIAFLGWLAARGRGLVPVLAIRRSTREATTRPVLVVLMATATVGAFSAATLVHLDRAADSIAWHEVGAPYRIDAPTSLPTDADPAALPGVTRAAEAYRATVAITQAGIRYELLALDAADFAAVVDGTPAAVGLPDGLLAADSEPPFPAIVSSALAEDPDGLAVGETFDLALQRHTAEFQAVEARDTFPSLPVGGFFVVVSRPQLESVEPDRIIATNQVFLSGDPSRTDELSLAVAGVQPGARLLSRDAASAAIRGSPIVRAVSAGVIAATAVAAIYSVLAVAVALVLTAAGRADEVGYLRALGLSGRQRLLLIATEHLPPILLASAVGSGLGLALFVFLRADLGLAEIVGSPLSIPLAVGPVHLLLLVAAVAAVVTVAVVLAAALGRSASTAAALRKGIG